METGKCLNFGFNNISLFLCIFSFLQLNKILLIYVLTERNLAFLVHDSGSVAGSYRERDTNQGQGQGQ